MPYQIRWVVPQRVILTTMIGTVTRPELERYIDEIRSEIRKGQKPVYHISNSLMLDKVELSLKAFQELLKSISMFNELGMQVDINNHALNKMLASFAGQFVKVRTRTVTTPAEAIALLKRTDPTLETVEWSFSEGESESPTLNRPPKFTESEKPSS
ncbi:MAG: hypothetical protein IAE80_11730 [Anaerolinea sp.]|nr:hypothetical protein [Anaerolinea sp.]